MVRLTRLTYIAAADIHPMITTNTPHTAALDCTAVDMKRSHVACRAHCDSQQTVELGHAETTIGLTCWSHAMGAAKILQIKL